MEVEVGAREMVEGTIIALIEDKESIDLFGDNTNDDKFFHHHDVGVALHH